MLKRIYFIHIILIFAGFLIFFTNAFNIETFLMLINVLLLFLYCLFYMRDKMLTHILMYFYLFLITFIQPLVGKFYPALLTAPFTSINAYLSVSNRFFYQKLLLLINLSYLIAYTFYVKFNRINLCRFLRNLFSSRRLKIHITFWQLIIIFTFEYIVRLKFKIGIPGKQPSLPYLGYVYYFFRSINLFLFSSFFFSILKKSSSILFFIFLISIFSLPDVLLGWRGSLPLLLVQSFLYYIFILKHKLLYNNRTLIIVSVILIFIAIGISNFIRFSYISGLVYARLFLQRITGFSDAIAIINYYNNFLPVHLPIYNIISITTKSAARFYTYDILNFPIGASTSFSRPIFATLLIYTSDLFLIFIFLFFIFFILLFLEKVSKDLVTIDFNLSFLFFYLYFHFFTFLIIQGNIHSFFKTLFSVPLMFIFFNSFLKISMLNKKLYFL